MRPSAGRRDAGERQPRRRVLDHVQRRAGRHRTAVVDQRLGRREGSQRERVERAHGILAVFQVRGRARIAVIIYTRANIMRGSPGLITLIYPEHVLTALSRLPSHVSTLWTFTRLEVVCNFQRIMFDCEA